MNYGKRISLAFLLTVAGCHSAKSITPEETGEIPVEVKPIAKYSPGGENNHVETVVSSR